MSDKVSPKSSNFIQKSFNQFTVQALTEQIYQGFSKNQALCRYLGMRYDDFAPLIRPVVALSMECTSAMVTVDENEGQPLCLISQVPYNEYSKIQYEGMTEKGILVKKILKNINGIFEPEQPNKTLIFKFAVTRSDYLRSGLISQLFYDTSEKAKEEGYTAIMCDCSNIISYKAALKHGFEEKGKIYYRNVRVENDPHLLKGLSNEQFMARMIKYL